MTTPDSDQNDADSRAALQLGDAAYSKNGADEEPEALDHISDHRNATRHAIRVAVSKIHRQQERGQVTKIDMFSLRQSWAKLGQARCQLCSEPQKLRSAKAPRRPRDSARPTVKGETK